jgi:hypothetical protein
LPRPARLWGGRDVGRPEILAFEQEICVEREATALPSFSRRLGIRYGINAEFLADMGEFLRVGQAAVRHHLE